MDAAASTLSWFVTSTDRVRTLGSGLLLAAAVSLSLLANEERSERAAIARAETPAVAYARHVASPVIKQLVT